MRLVYVTAGFPFPLTSGYLRHYHLLERLAQRHEVRLFSLVGRDHAADDRAAVRRLGVDVETFDVDASALRRNAAKLARVAPRIVAGGARDLRRAVGECVESGWADAAIVGGKSTVGVLSALGGLPVLVDACDATSMRLESRLSDRRGIDKQLATVEFRSVRAVERRLYARADHVTVASRRDARYLGWSARTSVVPNGVDHRYWTRSSAARARDTVIFTGKMSYGPNEDAALRLVDDVWPRVRDRRPDAQLRIVGTSPRRRLVDAGGRDGVEVTGRVDDIRPHLAAATVFAAPIRYGAGIQNKLLEALSMELPVVASTNASEGLVVDGEAPPVRIADDVDLMADLIVAELESADRNPSPIEANRAWVTDRFDWDASARRVDDLLHEIADRRVRGGKP